MVAHGGKLSRIKAEDYLPYNYLTDLPVDV